MTADYFIYTRSMLSINLPTSNLWISSISQYPNLDLTMGAKASEIVLKKSPDDVPLHHLPFPSNETTVPCASIKSGPNEASFNTMIWIKKYIRAPILGGNHSARASRKACKIRIFKCTGSQD